MTPTVAARRPIIALNPADEADLLNDTLMPPFAKAPAIRAPESYLLVVGGRAWRRRIIRARVACDLSLNAPRILNWLAIRRATIARPVQLRCAKLQQFVCFRFA